MAVSGGLPLMKVAATERYHVAQRAAYVAFGAVLGLTGGQVSSLVILFNFRRGLSPVGIPVRHEIDLHRGGLRNALYFIAES